MYKIIVTAKSFAKESGEPVQYLEKNQCEIIRLPHNGGNLKEQLREEIRDADGIIAGVETYDKEILAKAEKLKVISRYGVGYDSVDLSGATEKGIAVTITPGANENAVADLAFTLMLSAARHVPFMDAQVKQGLSTRPMGVEMWKKTIGIVGLGRIGKNVALRARGFQMKILCYDVYQDQKFAAENGVTYCDFDRLVQEADFISIHLPLLPETKNMFGKGQFEAMKKRAVLVNTARGGIIEEDALFDALQNGQIGAAGLDTTVVEPLTDSKLTQLPNCILTPHAGAATVEASYQMSMMAAENAVMVLQGKQCPYTV